MKVSEVSNRFAVAPQLLPEDMQKLADASFGTVICNRPDGEEDGQPPIAAMREAAENAGLAFHHIPVSGGEFPPAAIRAFGKVREEAERKVLAYCRSGARSIMLDALANTERLSAEQRIANAREAGYDLSNMRARLGEEQR